ncbi:glycoside hydrolase [Halothiobacillus sp. DCM-1]|uniref:glycoside hydrolase n=1 Tax=Halothiobacillus sp. DCM-1 TaxID=3112558 RepID=UPI0032462F81
MNANKLSVVLCWHMHQPEYRDPRTAQYQQPWTYLHAIKDYVDMAAHLERYPAARAVVNFVPILLEQLDDYGAQIGEFVQHQNPVLLRDVVLRSLVAADSLTDPDERVRVVRALTRANEDRLVRRFEPFQDLIDLARAQLTSTERGEYFSDAFISDLSVWYHLAWMGETVRRSDPLIQSLMTRAAGFSVSDRLALLTRIGELIQGIFPRYRALAEAGRVELSMTPYAHPIMPLLLDVRAGTETLPHDPQPQGAEYALGAERVRWHLQHGLAVFERYFGRRPVGCWPSEGAISEPTIHALSQAGFTWAASGNQVLKNSLAKQNSVDSGCGHAVWQFDHLSPALFFRDDGLSDLIGFDYQKWHADDAVGDFIGHLERIAQSCSGSNAVVPIILDGENAWEFYPDNGYWLLDALYKRLSTHPQLVLTTFAEVVERVPARRILPHLVAGSWVYGNLATWIGSDAKNRAWDLLMTARLDYERAEAAGTWDASTQARNRQQLAICEGSDWFWWFGDYNPGDAVRDFDALYRLQLTRLYELIGLPVPSALSQPICLPPETTGDQVEAGGIMRRGQ